MLRNSMEQFGRVCPEIKGGQGHLIFQSGTWLCMLQQWAAMQSAE